jgi:hypothetical protein
MDPTAPKRPSASEIERAIGVVRAYYAEGVAEVIRGKQYGSAGSASEKAYRSSARAFATPVTGYTEAELDRVFVDCRRLGWILNVSHFVKLLTVPKGPVRTALENEILVGCWSANLLKAVIRQRFGNRRPKAGRRRRVSDWDDARAQMIHLVDQWARLRGQGVQKRDGESAPATNRYRVAASASLDRKLKSVDAALFDLKKHLENQLKGRHRS